MYSAAELGAKTGLTSYTNLIPHIKSVHPDYPALLPTDSPASTNKLDKCFQKIKPGTYYSWLAFVINVFLSFTVVKKCIF